jgi:hypothetical protein
MILFLYLYQQMRIFCEPLSMVLLELELCGRELAGGKGEKTEKEKE